MIAAEGSGSRPSTTPNLVRRSGTIASNARPAADAESVDRARARDANVVHPAPLHTRLYNAVQSGEHCVQFVLVLSRLLGRPGQIGRGERPFLVADVTRPGLTALSSLQCAPLSFASPWQLLASPTWSFRRCRVGAPTLLLTWCWWCLVRCRRQWPLSLAIALCLLCPCPKTRLR